jgi:murein DD-endopeptidase MepM/ murein hydrolase activator NlpD
MKIKTIYLFGVVFLLAACSSNPVRMSQNNDLPSVTASVTPSLLPTETPIPSETPEPTATSTPTPEFKVCSPLEGLTLEDLPPIMKNAMATPHPGTDDGHQGVDLAYYSLGGRKQMLEHPIQSVLTGKVVGVVNNHDPYGNMIMIESEEGTFPASLLDSIAAPQPVATIEPAKMSLNCPTLEAPPAWETETRRSLYLLYAHLNKPTTLKMGDTVKCGDVIGEVGTTGWSVNPHLHLEVRIGPAGAGFTQMGHYYANASAEEMHNYCTWRASGLFGLIDPMRLLNIKP